MPYIPIKRRTGIALDEGDMINDYLPSLKFEIEDTTDLMRKSMREGVENDTRIAVPKEAYEMLPWLNEDPKYRVETPLERNQRIQESQKKKLEVPQKIKEPFIKIGQALKSAGKFLFRPMSELNKKVEEGFRMEMLETYKKQFPMVRPEELEGLTPAEQEVFYRTKAREQIYEGEKTKEAKVPEGYKEPENLAGQLLEGTKQFWVQSLAPGIGYTMEAMGRKLKIPRLTVMGQQIGDVLYAEGLKRPEILPPPDLFERIFTDPKTGIPMAVGRFAGVAIPYMLSAVGGAILGGAVGGPVGAKVGGFLPMYAVEKSSFYKELIDQKVDPAVADKASDIYGTVSAVIENISGFTPTGIAQIITQPAKQTLNMSWRNFLIRELPKELYKWQLKSIEEGGEEVAQQFTQDLITKWMNLPETPTTIKEMLQEFGGGYLGALPLGLFTTDIPKLQIGATIEPIESIEEPEKEILNSVGKMDEGGNILTNIKKNKDGTFSITEKILRTGQEIKLNMPLERALDLIQNVYNIPAPKETKPTVVSEKKEVELIPEERESLVNEAVKYENVEEFINHQLGTERQQFSAPPRVKNITPEIEQYTKDLVASAKAESGINNKIQEIYIVGSRAKGTSRIDSDVDFVVKFDPELTNEEFRKFEDSLNKILNRLDKFGFQNAQFYGEEVLPELGTGKKIFDRKELTNLYNQVKATKEAKPEVEPLSKELKSLKKWIQKEVKAGRLKSAEEAVQDEWQDRRAMGGGEPYSYITIGGKNYGYVVNAEDALSSYDMPIPEGIVAVREDGSFVYNPKTQSGIFDDVDEAEEAIMKEAKDFYNQVVEEMKEGKPETKEEAKAKAPVKEEDLRNDLYKSINQLQKSFETDGLPYNTNAIKSLVRELPSLEKKWTPETAKKYMKENIEDLENSLKLLEGEFNAGVRKKNYKIEQRIAGGATIEKTLSKTEYENNFRELKVKLDNYVEFWKKKLAELEAKPEAKPEEEIPEEIIPEELTEEEQEKVVKYFEKEKKKFFKEEGKRLIDTVVRLGGLKVPEDIKEEMSTLPARVLKNGKFTPDEMISQINGVGGYNFQSDMELIDAIKSFEMSPEKSKKAIPTMEEIKKIKGVPKDLIRMVGSKIFKGKTMVAETYRETDEKGKEWIKIKGIPDQKFSDIIDVVDFIKEKRPDLIEQAVPESKQPRKSYKRSVLLKQIQKEIEEGIFKRLRAEHVRALREEKKELLEVVTKKQKELPKIELGSLEWKPSTLGYNNPYTKAAYRVWDKSTKWLETKTPSFLRTFANKQVAELALERQRIIDGLQRKLNEDIVKKIEKLPDAEKRKLGMMINQYMPVSKEYQGLVKNIHEEVGTLSKVILDKNLKWVREGSIKPEDVFLTEETFLTHLGGYARTFYIRAAKVPGKEPIIIPPRGRAAKAMISTSMFKRKMSLMDWGRQALLHGGKSESEIAAMTNEEIIQYGLEAKIEYGWETRADIMMDRTYKDLINNYAVMEWQDVIIHTPEFFSREAKEGFIPVSDLLPRGMKEDRRLGPLNGGYINPGLADEIQIMITHHEDTIDKVLGEPLSWWKAFKVAGNPAAVFRNWLSGALFQTDMAGLPVWTPKNIKSYVQAVKSYISKDGIYRKYRDAGAYGADYHAVEIDEQMIKKIEASDNPATTLSNELLKKLGGKIKDSKKLFEYYGAIDHIQRTYLINIALENEATLPQAIHFANKWELNYRFAPKIIEKMRGSIGGWAFPFISFYSLMAPRILEVTVTRPWVFIKYPIFIALLGALSRKRLGYDKDEEESAKPSFLKGDPYTILLPFTDENNLPIFLNLTYSLPIGGWKTGFIDVPGIVDMARGMGLAGGLIAVLNNYDTFTKKPIYNENDLDSVKRKKVALYALRFISPGAVQHVLNIWDAAQGKPIGWPYPRRRDLTQVILRTVGISTYTGGVNEAILKIRELEQGINDINYAVNRLWEDTYVGKISKKEAEAKTKEAQDLIKRKQEEIMKIKKSMPPCHKGLFTYDRKWGKSSEKNIRRAR